MSVALPGALQKLLNRLETRLQAPIDRRNWLLLPLPLLALDDPLPPTNALVSRLSDPTWSLLLILVRRPLQVVAPPLISPVAAGLGMPIPNFEPLGVLALPLPLAGVNT